MYEINIVELSPQPVLGMRRRGAYREIAVMLPKVYEFAFKKKFKIAGYPTFVWHETTAEEAKEADKEENADIEVVVPISEIVEITDNEEIRGYELPGGKMAKIVHQGPYEGCINAYDVLFSWVSEKGKRIIGPIREVYFNDPREVPPEEILTEIYAPID
jgi:AraC family transcriptional regulator